MKDDAGFDCEGDRVLPTGCQSIQASDHTRDSTVEIFSRLTVLFKPYFSSSGLLNRGIFREYVLVLGAYLGFKGPLGTGFFSQFF